MGKRSGIDGFTLKINPSKTIVYDHIVNRSHEKTETNQVLVLKIYNPVPACDRFHV